MKFIALKTIKIDGQQFDYQQTLKQIIRIRPEGIDLEEMRQALRILDKIESATDWLVLEDAEYQIVVSRVKAQKWMSVSREILDFADSILAAPSKEPEQYLAAKTA